VLWPQFDFGRVFGRGVLRIVNQQIRAGREFRMAQVGSNESHVPVGGRVRVRFVIACVDDARAVGLDPVREGQRRVVQVMRGDANVVDLEAALEQVPITDRRAERLERDREVGRLHLARERLAQRPAEPFGPADVPFVRGVEQRREKRQPLDVVPVSVTDQEAPALDPLGDESLSQSVGARAAIDDDQRSARRAHFDA
jgi:hypothetical protein